MTRRVLGLALGLAALPVAAQGVVLGGWALPEGAVVKSTSTSVMRGRVAAPGGPVPVEQHTGNESVTQIDRVEGGRLTRAVQRTVASETKLFMAGSRLPSEPDPLVGRMVAVVRDGDGWRQEPVGWRPSAAAREALDEPATLDDAEYAARPVAVGETVEVDAQTLRRVYLDATDGDHHLTVTLDSVGTFGGGPAAFLTQRVGVTTAFDGGTMRMDMTARVVRRLDWKLDVRTVWEGPVAIAMDAVTITGTMRYEAEQAVTFPESP